MNLILHALYKHRESSSEENLYLRLHFVGGSTMDVEVLVTKVDHYGDVVSYSLLMTPDARKKQGEDLVFINPDHIVWAMPITPAD